MSAANRDTECHLGGDLASDVEIRRPRVEQRRAFRRLKLLVHDLFSTNVGGSLLVSIYAHRPLFTTLPHFHSHSRTKIIRAIYGNKRKGRRPQPNQTLDGRWRAQWAGKKA